MFLGRRAETWCNPRSEAKHLRLLASRSWQLRLCGPVEKCLDAFRNWIPSWVSQSDAGGGRHDVSEGSAAAAPRSVSNLSGQETPRENRSGRWARGIRERIETKWKHVSRCIKRDTAIQAKATSSPSLCTMAPLHVDLPARRLFRSLSFSVPVPWRGGTNANGSGTDDTATTMATATGAGAKPDSSCTHDNFAAPPPSYELQTWPIPPPSPSPPPPPPPPASTTITPLAEDADGEFHPYQHQDQLTRLRMHSAARRREKSPQFPQIRPRTSRGSFESSRSRSSTVSTISTVGGNDLTPSQSRQRQRACEDCWKEFWGWKPVVKSSPWLRLPDHHGPSDGALRLLHHRHPLLSEPPPPRRWSVWSGPAPLLLSQSSVPFTAPGWRRSENSKLYVDFYPQAREPWDNQADPTCSEQQEKQQIIESTPEDRIKDPEQRRGVLMSQRIPLERKLDDLRSRMLAKEAEEASKSQPKNNSKAGWGIVGVDGVSRKRDQQPGRTSMVRPE